MRRDLFYILYSFWATPKSKKGGCIINDYSPKFPHLIVNGLIILKASKMKQSIYLNFKTCLLWTVLQELSSAQEKNKNGCRFLYSAKINLDPETFYMLASSVTTCFQNSTHMLENLLEQWDEMSPKLHVIYFCTIKNLLDFKKMSTYQIRGRFDGSKERPRFGWSWSWWVLLCESPRMSIIFSVCYWWQLHFNWNVLTKVNIYFL